MMVECHLLYVDEIKGLYLVSVRAVTEQEYANETKIQKSLAEIPGASWFRGVLCMHLWFLSPRENAPCPVLTGKDSRSLHSASLDTAVRQPLAVLAILTLMLLVNCAFLL